MKKTILIIALRKLFSCGIVTHEEYCKILARIEEQPGEKITAKLVFREKQPVFARSFDMTPLKSE